MQKIAPFIDDLPGILSWSVDMEKRDKVLRVISSKLEETDVIGVFNRSSYAAGLLMTRFLTEQAENIY